MKKYLIYMWVFAYAMTGCNNKDFETESQSQPENGIPLKLSVAKERSALKIFNDRFEESDRVGLYMINPKMTLTEEDAIFVNADNLELESPDSRNLIPADPQRGDLYYPKFEEVSLIAYYPFTASVTNHAIDINVANQEAALIKDILYSNNATDLPPSEEIVELEFNYLLAKVVITAAVTGPASGDHGIGASAAQMMQSTMTLEGMNTQAKLQLENGEITDMGTPSTIRLFRSGAPASINDLNGGWAKFEALILPAEITAEDRVEVVLNVGGRTFRAPITGEFRSGETYPFNIVFNNPTPNIIEVESFTVSQVDVLGNILNPLSYVNLVVNQTFNYKVAILPVNAFFTSFYYEIEDENVVAFDETNTGIYRMRAVGPGATTITFHSYDGINKIVCYVNVAATGNRLNNPGFEEPVQTGTYMVNITTAANNMFQLQWKRAIWDNTNLANSWYHQFYDGTPRIPGVTKENNPLFFFGPGNAGGDPNRAGPLNTAGMRDPDDAGYSWFHSQWGMQWFDDDGSVRTGVQVGDWITRLASGANSRGIYQEVRVEPGRTYRFGAIIGARENGVNERLRDANEYIKILSSDGLTVYGVAPYNLYEDHEIWRTANCKIMRVRGEVTIPAGVTQVRFLIDQRNFGTGTAGQPYLQAPLQVIDECYFELKN